jgi:hypothetical protein
VEIKIYREINVFEGGEYLPLFRGLQSVPHNLLPSSQPLLLLLLLIRKKKPAMEMAQ